MSKVTELAAGQLTGNGSTSIIIELIEADETPAVFIVRWPSKPTVLHPRRFPDTAATAAKLFAEAATRLASIKAADLLSNPSAWISRAPAAAFRRERLRFRTVRAWLWGLFRPAASLPATARPQSRMSFMITFGFASTR